MSDWLKAALDYIPSWFEFQMRATGQPGGIVAVAYRGKIVLETAFGYAHLANGSRLTPRHRFRAASHSKSVTAAALLKLRDLNKLELDDPIGNHVPAVGERVARLTISQVLCHGGGIIRDGTDCGYFYNRRPFPKTSELLTELQSPPLIKPNSRFKYSNHGYGLLGLVIESVTGENYGPWVKREILDPAGLRESTPDVPIHRGALFARGHTSPLFPGERYVIPGDYSTGALAPASGLISTAADLATFYAQLSPRAGKSILSPASRRDMVRKRFRNLHSAVPVYYGFGVTTGTTDGWDWFGHGGALEGYVSRTKMLPAQDIAVCAATMATDGPAKSWVNGVIHILQAFRSGGGPAKKLMSWEGRWLSPWGAVDLVAMRKVVKVANPQSANPFLDASELRVRSRDQARIAPSTGFLYFGELARRVRDRRGKVRELWFGGDKLLPASERAAEIKKLYGNKGSVRQK